MRDPQALMSAEQLTNILGQSSLRVYDCTTYLETPPPGSDDPYVAVPGRRTFEEAHIPGADFLDLQGEFSDATTRLRFMMPATVELEAAFGRHGLGTDSRVVLYSIGTMMWATRFWWMLRSLGFDRAAVLDGGLDKWKAEGRPTESGPARGYPPATFKAAPRPGFHVAVGRRSQGVTRDKRVICYCGGGISATVDLFLLYQLGHDRLTLYDVSMGEWAKDRSLPIETD